MAEIDPETFSYTVEETAPRLPRVPLDADLYMECFMVLVRGDIAMREEPCRQDVRDWWEGAKDERKRHRLTREQISYLLSQCREIALALPETIEAVPIKQKTPYKRR